MTVGCVQCQTEAPHRLHIQVTDNAIIFTDNDGNVVELPCGRGISCPLCNQEVSFIDPEFGNAFCLPCQWMGKVAINAVKP